MPDPYALNWSRRSRRDLVKMARYIQAYNPAAAQKMLRLIVCAAQNATLMPKAGRAVPEAGDSLVREGLIQRYRVVYRIDEVAETLSILTVFEGHRSFPTEIL